MPEPSPSSPCACSTDPGHLAGGWCWVWWVMLGVVGGAGVWWVMLGVVLAQEFHVDLVRTSMLDAARALATLQVGACPAPWWTTRSCPVRPPSSVLAHCVCCGSVAMGRQSVCAPGVCCPVQTAFGVAPLLKGKGEAARVVADALVNIMREQKGSVPPVRRLQRP